MTDLEIDLLVTWANKKGLKVRRTVIPYCGYSDSGAAFTEDERHRPLLWRVWDREKRLALFIMLNPSTANEVVLDPTVTRCKRYAEDWGYGGLIVCNLFDFRATDPRAMKAQGQTAFSGYNRLAILQACKVADLVVCAWGTHGELFQQNKYIAAWIKSAGHAMHYLKLTKHGHPAHPLYLKRDLKPQVWEFSE